MVFSSFVFIWIFLPIIFIGNYFAQRFTKGNTLANALLLIASIFFYAWGEPIYINLMIVSIIINWIAGMLIDSAKHKKCLLVLFVVINIGILGYFKYAVMIIQTINQMWGVSYKIPDIPLPIGISFFTFQALSYVIDVYRGKCDKQPNILKLALYISFFPQLIAGPIVQYKDVVEQIDYRTVSVSQTAAGIRRFMYGFAKKVLISNILAMSVDEIYSLEIIDVTWSLAWIASLFYTLQIYYDFSGYSDMAIGLGKIFGFEFKENFNYPYTAHSIREFWRKWHISLSTWFKDYVYIPLGGSRKGKRITYENLIIVFLLTGLWHGASWNFVFWGLFHGIFMLIERTRVKNFLKRHHIFSWIYCFFVVNFSWIFFRIINIRQAFAYIKRMILPWKYNNNPFSILEIIDFHTIFVAVISIVGMGMIQTFAEKNAKLNRWKNSIPEMIFCTLIMLLSIASLAGGTYNPFIYFRF
ncbi:MAG: MBOAT family O-acyltransferase [Lachnospiraceae bacterium]